MIITLSTFGGYFERTGCFDIYYFLPIFSTSTTISKIGLINNINISRISQREGAVEQGSDSIALGLIWNLLDLLI